MGVGEEEEADTEADIEVATEEAHTGMLPTVVVAGESTGLTSRAATLIEAQGTWQGLLASQNGPIMDMHISALLCTFYL